MSLLDLIALLGLLLIAAGAGWVYPPAGLIVAGVEALVVGVSARAEERKRDS